MLFRSQRMEKLAGKLSDHLIVKGVVEAEDRDIYIFGLECLLGSVVQTTVSLVLALLTGVLPQTIACIITFGSLKKWAGGFHAGTHLSCIGISTATMLILSFAAKLIPTQWGLPVLLVSLLVAIVLVIRLAPIVHPYNPKTPEQVIELRKRSRIVLAVISTCLLGAYFLLPESVTSIVLAGAIGQAASALTLLIPAKLKEGGE